ncbi:MAG: maleylacetoacetate isomerase [Burkholderiales bacterium]|nr:maleylacetoacetate isomerase [Burkholderiales bacterium]
MKLYNYYRSSAAYRVRIALNLKGLSWDHVGVHLLKREHRNTEYLALNPAGLVPTLIDDDGTTLTQSLAIIEYLEETKAGTPPLLPKDPAARAYVRSLAMALACDVHPLNNVRVLNYITGELGATDAQKSAWIAHWIEIGLDAFEKVLLQSGLSGQFCYGDLPTMADCVLVPQVFSARRFNVDVSKFPRVAAIESLCNTLPAFIGAHPKNQSDFAP